MDQPPATPKPVSARVVERFASAFTGLLDAGQVGAGAVMAFAAETAHPDELAVAVVRTVGSPAALAAVDQLTGGGHRLLGAATRVGWSPSARGPSSPSWLVAVVSRGRPVWAAVRRDHDDVWTLLAPEDLPWIALSTVAALRAVIDHGQPLSLKHTTNPRLLRPPHEQPDPPTDDHGSL